MFDAFETRKACPICGSAIGAILYEREYAAQPLRSLLTTYYAAAGGHVDWTILGDVIFRLIECSRCRLIYQESVPTPRMLDELYNVMIDQSFLRRFEHEKLTRDGWAEVSGELQTLFNSFQKPYGKLTFLDFGFGFGRWARVAKGMGARVFATEISPEKKKAAESLGVEIVDEDSLGQMQFDVVQAEQVAEHLTRPAETLQMLAQSVAPGGILKVAVPRPGKIKYLLRRFGMPDRAPQEHCLRHDASLQGVSDEDYVGVFPLEHLNLFCDKTMELLAVRLNMCIESKVRSRVLPIGIGSRKDLIRSAGSLAKETARRAAGAFLKNRGYYVFRAGGM